MGSDLWNQDLNRLNPKGCAPLAKKNQGPQGQKVAKASCQGDTCSTTGLIVELGHWCALFSGNRRSNFEKRANEGKEQFTASLFVFSNCEEKIRPYSLELRLKQANLILVFSVELRAGLATAVTLK